MRDVFKRLSVSRSRSQQRSRRLFLIGRMTACSAHEMNPKGQIGMGPFVPNRDSERSSSFSFCTLFSMDDVSIAWRKYGNDSVSLSLCSATPSSSKIRGLRIAQFVGLGRKTAPVFFFASWRRSEMFFLFFFAHHLSFLATRASWPKRQPWNHALTVYDFENHVDIYAELWKCFVTFDPAIMYPRAIYNMWRHSCYPFVFFSSAFADPNPDQPMNHKMKQRRAPEEEQQTTDPKEPTNQEESKEPVESKEPAEEPQTRRVHSAARHERTLRRSRERDCENTKTDPQNHKQVEPRSLRRSHWRGRRNIQFWSGAERYKIWANNWCGCDHCPNDLGKTHTYVDFTSYCLEWGEFQVGLNTLKAGVLPRTQVGTSVPVVVGLQNVDAKVNLLRYGAFDLALDANGSPSHTRLSNVFWVAVSIPPSASWNHGPFILAANTSFAAQGLPDLDYQPFDFTDSGVDADACRDDLAEDGVGPIFKQVWSPWNWQPTFDSAARLPVIQLPRDHLAPDRLVRQSATPSKSPEFLNADQIFLDRKALATFQSYVVSIAHQSWNHSYLRLGVGWSSKMNMPLSPQSHKASTMPGDLVEKTENKKDGSAKDGMKIAKIAIKAIDLCSYKTKSVRKKDTPSHTEQT